VLPLQAALVIWLLLPSAASPLLMGGEGTYSIHPASVLSLIHFIYTLITGRLAVGFQGRRVIPWRSILVLALMAAGILLNATTQGPKGLALLFDLMIAPSLWFCSALAATQNRPSFTQEIVNVALAATGASAVLGIVQAFTGSVILYEDYYATIYWFDTHVTRAIGTADSPVALAMLISVATPLLAFWTDWRLKIPFLLVFLASAVVTQSRVGTVLTAGGVAFVVLAGRITFGRLFAVAVIGLSATVTFAGSLADGLIARFDNDKNSTGLRETALDYFTHRMDSIVWSGHGAGAGVALRTARELESSLENGYLIYAWDLGILFTAALLLLQLGFLMSKAPGESFFTPGRVAAIAAIGSCISFSSFGASSTVTAMFWCALLVSYASGRLSLPASPRKTHQVTRK
jgi:hypothetical protein